MNYFSEWTIKIIACFIIGLVTFLPIIIVAIHNRKHHSLQWCEDGYVMCQPVEFFVISVLIAVGHFIFVVMGIVIIDRYTIYGLPIFMIGLFVGSGLSIYALLWRCVVGEDSMTFYTPFLPVKTIKFYEITKVTYRENRTYGYGGGKKVLTGYRNKKKIFQFYDNIIGFDLLYEQLRLLGKIESVQLKEEFSLRETKGNILRVVFGVMMFGGIFLAFCICNDEEIQPFYYIAFAGITLFYLIDLICVLLWRVTVNYNTIHIRNSFGKTITFAIRDITKVQEQQNHIVLYVGDKKIVKISKDYENYLLLQERLMYEGINWIKK